MDWSPRTLAIVSGRPQGPGAPLNTPIVAASTFEAGGGVVYSRSDGTATWAALEDAVGALEGGQATAYASGVATLSAILDTLPVGSSVVVPTFSYALTRGVLKHAQQMGRLTVTELDPTDTAAWQAADADLLWLESPTNPTLDVMDIEAIASAARGRVVVDNTLATPLQQQPLRMGADIVVHSATKMIGGHSDLLLGIAVTNDEQIAQDLRNARTRVGATPGALEAYLALRGLRTMPVRLAEQERTAALLASRLAEHPSVTKVRYPGFGMMVSFETADAESAGKVCDSVELIRSATSLGGVETLVERRAWLPGEERVPPGLIRMSVGLEDPEDLWHDLHNALT
ncbi:PLP-dependent aspartate aminotransferase family protein [Kibdelosporangium persicum]|uniref:Cystathionine beta-lyase/cystathionine gamma-synthase n=1 Tax=Kibdelosporangium persicum TaxID=2698649 RepID=A0ABX2F2C5_9PSEU|nr:PLP-dependent transferase [Kibdelosporangium persicum]NRN65457.1 Cystathionine beta-lyase/cystathionine gamma-synthase [Kibdelosporangium persicum]